MTNCDSVGRSDIKQHITEWTSMHSTLSKWFIRTFNMKKTKSHASNIPVATYSGAAYPWVPIILVETWVLSPVGPSLAKPKSESFALKSYIKFSATISE